MISNDDIECIILIPTECTEEFKQDWGLPPAAGGVYYIPKGTDLYTYLAIKLISPQFGRIPGFISHLMLKYPYDPEEVQRVHQARDARMAQTEKRQELPNTRSTSP